MCLTTNAGDRTISNLYDVIEWKKGWLVFFLACALAPTALFSLALTITAVIWINVCQKVGYSLLLKITAQALTFMA